MKPKVSWKKSEKPAAVLEKIRKARTVTADDSISFSGMEFHEWVAIVETMLQFPNEPAIAQQNRIVYGAMFHCPAPITPESFLDEVNAQYAKL